MRRRSSSESQCSSASRASRPRILLASFDSASLDTSFQRVYCTDRQASVGAPCEQSSSLSAFVALWMQSMLTYGMDSFCCNMSNSSFTSTSIALDSPHASAAAAMASTATSWVLSFLAGRVMTTSNVMSNPPSLPSTPTDLHRTSRRPLLLVRLQILLGPVQFCDDTLCTNPQRFPHPPPCTFLPRVGSICTCALIHYNHDGERAHGGGTGDPFFHLFHSDLLLHTRPCFFRSSTASQLTADMFILFLFVRCLTSGFTFFSKPLHRVVTGLLKEDKVFTRGFSVFVQPIDLLLVQEKYLQPLLRLLISFFSTLLRCSSMWCRVIQFFHHTSTLRSYGQRTRDRSILPCSRHTLGVVNLPAVGLPTHSISAGAQPLAMPQSALDGLSPVPILTSCASAEEDKAQSSLILSCNDQSCRCHLACPTPRPVPSFFVALRLGTPFRHQLVFTVCQKDLGFFRFGHLASDDASSSTAVCFTSSIQTSSLKPWERPVSSPFHSVLDSSGPLVGMSSMVRTVGVSLRSK